MPLSASVARFNRHVTNRVAGLFADRAPGFAILHHIGRRSGKPYAIPVKVFRDGDDYLVALTYGVNTDWLKNVLVAGGCEIVTHSQRIRLTDPRVVTDASMGWAPLPDRLILRLIRAPDYLRMTRE